MRSTLFPALLVFLQALFQEFNESVAVEVVSPGRREHVLLEVVVITAPAVKENVVGLGIGLEFLDLEIGVLLAQGFLLLAVVFRQVPLLFGKSGLVVHVEGNYHIVVAQNFKHARV